ncbi:MAG TPA: hypothetical protein VMS86_06680 [Thermoanaerobaculia bacterium]|nr:hypothetical protein [Thermoanaerobaculia bacterium]
MEIPPALRGRPALLVVAHPGHELRVHGWLELARPEVWVLTDGGGRTGLGRLGSSRAVVERAGARVGPVFGAFTDQEAYRLLLAGDVQPVARLVERLADRLAAEEGPYVVGDALEGFNPVHDLCRVLVDLATARAERRTGRRIDSLDFPLEAAPDTLGRIGEDLRLLLDEAAVARKLTAAREYPEMATEVARALVSHGQAAFAVERLRPVDAQRSLAARLQGPPLYERFGEERVAAGTYRQVLRFAEHFAPFVAALTEAREASGERPESDKRSEARQSG